MAFLGNGINFEGSLGDYSAYRMKGCDRIVIRLKGGTSKKRIKTDPRMVNQRRTMSEFGAASKAAADLVKMLVHRRGWSTFGVQGDLTARLMHLRRSDTQSEWGKRSILFSQNPSLLEGAPLSQGRAFDACITSPIAAALSRDTRAAQITIPELVPGFNLSLPEDRPQYRIVAELITVPDLIFNPKNNRFEHHRSYSHFDRSGAETDWYASRTGSPATTLNLNQEALPPDPHFGLILTIGIQLGVMHDSSSVELVNKVGAAKVIAMS